MKTFVVPTDPSQRLRLTPEGEQFLSATLTIASKVPALRPEDFSGCAQLDGSPARETAARQTARGLWLRSQAAVMHATVGSMIDQSNRLVDDLVARHRDARSNVNRLSRAYRQTRAYGTFRFAWPPIAVAVLAILSIAVTVVGAGTSLMILFHSNDFPEEGSSVWERLPMTISVAVAAFWAVSAALSSPHWRTRAIASHIGVMGMATGAAAATVFVNQVELQTAVSLTSLASSSAGGKMSMLLLAVMTLEAVAMACAKWSLANALNELWDCRYTSHPIVHMAEARERGLLEDVLVATDVLRRATAMGSNLEDFRGNFENEAVAFTEALCSDARHPAAARNACTVVLRGGNGQMPVN